MTLNYQAIPPYYLKERFTIGKGPETQRLAYLTSHLTLPGTPIENWRLAIACGTRGFEDTKSQACSEVVGESLIRAISLAPRVRELIRPEGVLMKHDAWYWLRALH